VKKTETDNTISPAVAKKVAPVIATKPATTPVATKAPAVVAKSVSTTTTVAKPSSGFFDFLKKSDSSSSTPVATVTKVAPPVASGMNKSFLTLITKLLNNDAKKISNFQKATDQFRSNVIDANSYLKTIEGLFGIEQLELVIKPLIQDLPEKDLSNKLKNSFEKLPKVTTKTTTTTSIASKSNGNGIESDFAKQLNAIKSGVKKTS
jgi:hypothetical protein